jgi:sugar lactone lactonase YvrE
VQEDAAFGVEAAAAVGEVRGPSPVADDGSFIEQWRNFGRPSGIFINRETDTLYVTDSTSNVSNNPGVKRGIYIGSARSGEVSYFIPDPDLELADRTRISGASGITASADDAVIYAADVAPRQLRKYLRD